MYGCIHPPLMGTSRFNCHRYQQKRVAHCPDRFKLFKMGVAVRKRFYTLLDRVRWGVTFGLENHVPFIGRFWLCRSEPISGTKAQCLSGDRVA